MSLAIFFSFYGKVLGADLTHASQICPCLELSISRQPLLCVKKKLWKGQVSTDGDSEEESEYIQGYEKFRKGQVSTDGTERNGIQ